MLIKKPESRLAQFSRPRFKLPAITRLLLLCVLLICISGTLLAQAGPPYYTNDPGTPGNKQWEINFGYMPFFFRGDSVSHTPDVDINFGAGERVQLTLETAWLRVHNPGENVKYGLEQDQLGVKWRFHDGGEQGSSISVFPQFSVNNPNHSVRRDITPPGDSLLLPIEFSRKFGPIDVDVEGGYQFVHKGPDGWLTGIVIGHEFTKKLELDSEIYATGTWRPSYAQPTFDVGGRYKLHPPVILLFMAGRGFEPARSNQPFFVGYFGVQLLLPPKAFDKD
jgi:hypothetical protein